MHLVLAIAAALAGQPEAERRYDHAIELRKAADESGTVEDYLVAADALREALRRHPKHSENAYRLHWYLADTLYHAKSFRDAADEYELLLAREDENPYGDGAAYQVMRCWQELSGPYDRLPADATVERVYTTEWGKEITVYALSPEAQAFADAVDRVLTRPFAAVEAGEPDWKGTVEQNRRALMYIAAHLLMSYHRYEEARPRLLALVPEWDDEGKYAWQLLVDSYLAEGNLRAVRDYYPPHGGGRDPFPDQVGLKDAMNLVGTDRRAAAVAFLAFYDDYPDSEYRGIALYNAATSYDVIGAAEEANALYERFVAEYPKDEKSAQLYFRIASNYEAYLDLPGAIRFYDALVAHFPDDASASDAYYNAAFLRAGIGDHRGAAAGFEAYADRYPDRADTEEVYFQAGEQWARVSTAEETAFYARYLQRWGDANPEHAARAHRRLATLYEAAGDATRAAPHHAAAGPEQIVVAPKLMEVTWAGAVRTESATEIRPVEAPRKAGR